MGYSIQTEGSLQNNCVAKVDSDIVCGLRLFLLLYFAHLESFQNRSRTHFEVGDACNLRADLGSFGVSQSWFMVMFFFFFFVKLKTTKRHSLF